MVSYCRDRWSRWASGLIKSSSSDVDATIGIVLKLCHVWNARKVSLMFVPVVHSAVFTIWFVLSVDAYIFQFKLVGSIIAHHYLTGPFILHVKTRRKALVWYRPMAVVWLLLWGATASQLHGVSISIGFEYLVGIILVGLSNAFINQDHVRIVDALVSRVSTFLWWLSFDVLSYPRFNIVWWLSELWYQLCWFVLDYSRGRLVSVDWAW